MQKYSLEKARSLYPHTSTGRIYLNHAATSPLSTRVVQAIHHNLFERSEGSIDTYRSDLKSISNCRNNIATLIHAGSPDRIAFVSNTSEGINIISSGLSWKSGDRVLLNNAEFPANVHPYYRLKSSGVEFDFIQSDNGRVTPELVERAITSKTRLVALSAVQFLSGFRADLATIGKLCRQKRIWFVVDGIQAVGAINIDVQSMNIDALSAGSQKWQMAPLGTGFLYVTEELQEAIKPAHVGWLSLDDPWQFFNYDQPLASSARRFEGGTLNISGLLGLQAAIETLLEFGIDAIESHIITLTNIFIERLKTITQLKLISPMNISERSGIVTVESNTQIDLMPVFKHLASQRIDISIREGKLRFSPHYYNSPEEIEKTIEALKQVIYK